MSEDTSAHRDTADPAVWLDDHGDSLFAYAMNRMLTGPAVGDHRGTALLDAAYGALERA